MIFTKEQYKDHVFYVGISGGKDSTATALYMIYRSGIDPSRIILDFCDTGNEDPLTYAYIAYISQNIHPVHVTQPPLGFWELASKKKRFPARRARFCTERLKVIPTAKRIASLIEHSKVLMVSGIRRDEGKAHNDRGNLEQLYFDDTYGVFKYLPIYDLTLDQVWDLIAAHIPIKDITDLVSRDPFLTEEDKVHINKEIVRTGVPCNPLYHMGASRVGCFPCINSTKAEVRAMQKYRPQRVDFIEDAENAMNNRNGFSSFFAIKTTPPQYRTKMLITAKGEVVNVPPIREVVKWSLTGWGGKQMRLPLHFSPVRESCDKRGLCE